MGICELIKKISPSFSIAYDSAIFTFPSLTDFISDLSQEQQNAIMGGNAAKFYNLK